MVKQSLSYYPIATVQIPTKKKRGWCFVDWYDQAPY